jgi:peptidoglycan/LPS O-acetylase OafA/YrhL
MRIEQLTFTRFLAAVSIVIFHYGKGSTLFNNDAVSFVFRQANLGVSYFFVLSGFVMVIAYHAQSRIVVGDYLRNRFARIYPVYFLACILFLLHLISSKEVDYYELLLNLFMVQAWIPGEALSFNFPGWSISVEVFFYLIFPVLFNALYKRIDYRNMIFPILGIWIASQILLHWMFFTPYPVDYIFTARDVLYFPLMHCNEFLIGNLAGLFFASIPKETRKNFDLLIVLTIIIIVLILKFPFGLIYHNGLLAWLFVTLILLLSFNNGWLTKVFRQKPLIFLGEISFGLYILQFPIWSIISNQRLEKYFGLTQNKDFTLSFFVRLACLLLLSALSYVYFETPLRQRVKKLQQRPKFSAQ